MKNTFIRILALIFVALTLFSLASCVGEYHNATNKGNGHNTNTGSGVNSGSDTDGGEGDGGFVPPEMNDDPTDDFTVTLLADGKPYTPRTEMLVTWTDGFSVHTAMVDSNGTAKIDGLDGDYRVTVSGVPNEYAYDPNTNIATNDNKHVVLNLYSLNHLAGSSMDLYNCYSFRETGVYSAIINSPEDAIYFQYAPSGMGTYSIESWIDTTADNVNPYIEVYGGHSEYKYYIETKDDGGPIGSYTINFVHEVSIAKENISNGGGQVTYTFAIKAEQKNNQYPITIVFAVKRNGDFELNRPGSGSGTAHGMVVPEYDFTNFDKSEHEYGDDYRIAEPEYQLSSGSNVYVFDDRRFKLWEKNDGGDDFYHLYDIEKYAETDGYGPILYMYITKPARSFLDRAFTRIEYKNASAPANGNDETTNAALSVNGGNYKHLIEGYTQLATNGRINGASYYCDSKCTCHDASVSNEGWACTKECTNCLSTCRRIPKELIGFEGYQAYANSDGLVPVTEDLKTFLMGYCEKTVFFRDGLGTMENTPVNGRIYQAVSKSGWLFACAYYEQK